MSIAFLILLIVHGLLHLLGFVKAFDLAEVEQLTRNISQMHGILWGLATILFLITAALYQLDWDMWWVAALCSILLSQYLILLYWQDANFGTVANVLILLVTLYGYGNWNFRGKYERDVRDQLDRSGILSESILTEADLQPLPGLVQRYLRLNRAVGKPKVRNFEVKFSGKIRQGPDSDWMAFSGSQYNFIDSGARLFFMNARMKNLPIAGYHRFQNGRAIMDIRLASLIPVQYQSGDKMDRSETVTFFNDMCIMAPATLIDERVKWLETDGNRVKASFTHNDITISAWLHFNEKGALIDFISEDRYAVQEDGSMKQFPWSTPLKDYKEENGRYRASYGEAVYTYPDQEVTYGIFHIRTVDYNLDSFD